MKNAHIAEWFHIYLGTPTEHDLQNNPLDTNLDKLVDLLEVVMTDKIKTEKNTGCTTSKISGQYQYRIERRLGVYDKL